MGRDVAEEGRLDERCGGDCADGKAEVRLGRVSGGEGL
jgi:hypothetical protein